MKSISVKDFIIGVLVALLFVMLVGAGTNNKEVGLYSISVGGGGTGYSVCVHNSLKGETRCKGARKGGGLDSTMGMYGNWTFDPFSERPISKEFGLYSASVGGGGDALNLCATDSLTGQTYCAQRGMRKGYNSFSPDFSRK
jgi:hypothetical protein